jgi:phospholipid-binding lipoprotein MlaA
MRRTMLLLLSLVTAAGCSSSMRTPGGSDLAAAQPVPSSGPAGPSTSMEVDALEEEFERGPVPVADPLEGWNRILFQVNDRLYFWVLKPVAEVYKQIAPLPVRTGVRNVFCNVTAPVRFVNCLVQGKEDEAGLEFGRFMVNSTWGVLGIFDPAKDQLALEAPKEEDMGQTLGVHGVGQGLYIVWPGLGPSTLRDSAGLVVDLFLNPVTYVKPWEVSLGIRAVRTTNETSFSLGEYEALKSSAVEPYAAIRDAYLQYRARQVQP